MKFPFPFFIHFIVCFFYWSALGQTSSHFLDEKQPKYELGVGAIGLQSPFYPGAGQSRFRVIPFPFFIYRGEVFRADDEGTRARLQKAQSYEFGL